MHDTVVWILRLCTVIGVAVLGTLLFITVASAAAVWQKRRGVGFPRSRRFH